MQVILTLQVDNSKVEPFALYHFISYAMETLKQDKALKDAIVDIAYAVNGKNALDKPGETHESDKS